MGILIIFILLIATVKVIFPMFIKSKRNKEFLSSVHSFLTLITMCGLLLSVLCGGIANRCHKYENQQIKSQETSVVETTDLIALSDNNLTNGKFFLGNGSINNSSYYFYYAKTEHGYELNKLNADFYKVYIRYCLDNDKPRIEKESEKTIYEYSLKNKPSFWSWDIYNFFYYYNNEIGDVMEEKECDEIRHIIYVPEGSIKTDYTLDMQ